MKVRVHDPCVLYTWNVVRPLARNVVVPVTLWDVFFPMALMAGGPSVPSAYTGATIIVQLDAW